MPVASLDGFPVVSELTAPVASVLGFPVVFELTAPVASLLGFPVVSLLTALVLVELCVFVMWVCAASVNVDVVAPLCVAPALAAAVA